MKIKKLFLLNFTPIFFLIFFYHNSIFTMRRKTITLQEKTEKNIIFTFETEENDKINEAEKKSIISSLKAQNDNIDHINFNLSSISENNTYLELTEISYKNFNEASRDTIGVIKNNDKILSIKIPTFQFKRSKPFLIISELQKSIKEEIKSYEVTGTYGTEKYNQFALHTIIFLFEGTYIFFTENNTYKFSNEKNRQTDINQNNPLNVQKKHPDEISDKVNKNIEQTNQNPSSKISLQAEIIPNTDADTDKKSKEIIVKNKNPSFKLLTPRNIGIILFLCAVVGYFVYHNFIKKPIHPI